MRNLVAAATKTCEPTDPIRAVGERPADSMGFKEAGSPFHPAREPRSRSARLAQAQYEAISLAPDLGPKDALPPVVGGISQ